MSELNRYKCYNCDWITSDCLTSAKDVVCCNSPMLRIHPEEPSVQPNTLLEDACQAILAIPQPEPVLTLRQRMAWEYYLENGQEMEKRDNVQRDLIINDDKKYYTSNVSQPQPQPIILPESSNTITDNAELKLCKIEDPECESCQ